MARKWQILNESPRHIPNGLYVSLDKDYQLCINQKAFDELGAPAAVVLMYDPGTDAIGIRPTAPLMMNAHPVRKKASERTYRISAKPLCIKHEIKYDTTIQFLETSIEDGALVANLLKTRSTALKSRNSSRTGR